MKKQHLFITALSFFAFFFISSFSAQAQLESCIDNNNEVCTACTPSVGSITTWDFPFGCTAKVFTVNTSRGGNGLCDIAGYNWSTDDAGAVLTEVGGQCRIVFSGPGTYTVRVCFSVSYSPNPGAGVCCVCTEKTVTICP